MEFANVSTPARIPARIGGEPRAATARLELFDGGETYLPATAVRYMSTHVMVKFDAGDGLQYAWLPSEDVLLEP